MAQHAKVIDVTRSFIITDPNYFPENLGFTAGEDSPEKMPPILPYEGYNFMPTVYGCRSYFGINSTLNVAALTSRVDKILLFQLNTFQNILVALCEDGIWTTTPSVGASVWTHVVTHAVPAPTVHYNWTWCVIENILYCYKEGTPLVHKYSFAGAWTNFTPCCFKTYATTVARTSDVTYTAADIGKIVYDQQTSSYFTILTTAPTFTAGTATALRNFTINMAGQKGIFRANGRLGFWDSANSISWSDDSDLTDLVPSVETRAGNAIFLGVKGTIVQILAQGDGFAIYTTKGIVGVRFTNDINLIWEANSITDAAGIAYPNQVTTGITDLEHFAFTNTGIKKIGTFNALSKAHAFEEILTDTYDLLKESNQPVYLDFYNGRYLFLSVIDNTYINGRVSFSYHTIDSVTVRVLENGGAWSGLNIPPINVVGIVGLVYTPVAKNTAIASNISSGILENMMLWWNSTIATVCPVVLPKKTAAVPYTIDAATYQHIPNSPIYTGVTFNSENAVPYANASEITTLTGTTVAGSVSYANGGAKMGATLAASLAMKGIPDEFMTEALAAQTAEWANFSTIQAANKAAIEAIPSYVAPVVQGATPYVSSAAAQLAIDALVAAGGGSGMSHPVGVDANVGSFLSGAGTTAAPVVTTPVSIGTNSYSVTRTFLGGWDVKKRVTRTYSIRAGASTSFFQTGYASTQTPGPPGYAPDTAGTAAGWRNSPEVTGYGATQPLATEAMIALLITVLQPASGDGLWVDPFRGSPPNDSRFYYYDAATHTVTAHSHTGSGGAAGASPTYYIDYTDTTSILVTANAGITAPSTFSALQLDLRWAYIAQGESLGSFTSLLGSLVIPGAGINGSAVLPLYADISTPGATFLMSNGSPAPIYPTFTGAFVFDTALKKWGKMKQNFKQLLEMAPTNAATPTSSYTNFGVSLSMIDAAGAIKLFDILPSDSWIRYGKIGYSRLGFTKVQEIKAHFRNSSTGVLTLNSSIDGRSLEPTYSIPFPFTTAASIDVGCYNVGRWHTITISGNWDLQYLEFRANSAGKR